MEEVKIVYKRLRELKPYKNNPRKNDRAVEYVANSIKEFGFKVPIVITTDGEIVAGHTRYKASKKLGLNSVPCIVADDLSEEQIKAFRLADNKVSEFADWDMALLDKELDLINLDMEPFGFSDWDDIDWDDDFSVNGSNPITNEKYTTKVEIPQYEITGDEPSISELLDLTKTNELIKRIERSSVSEEQKAFLTEASKRHSVFNYAKIAEYYAHQDEEMQKLMEDSALVIVDFDDAIKNGYIQLRSEILGLEESEYEE